MNATATVMDTFTAIESRRSIKHYDPSHRMTEDEITRLIELAKLSPTSFNIQNWRFVCVTDPDLKKQLRAASWNQAQVEEASLVILLCADLTAHSNHPQRYWANAPQAVQDQLVPMIATFYDGNDQLIRDEAMRSVGMAGQTIMLAAKAMGYDTCPMIGYDPVKVAEIIRLPKDHVTGFMVVVGKALEPARARSGPVSLDEVLVYNHF
ncbi:MAG: nitroreductase family protein [Vampirovibrionales bacterium]